MGVIKEIAKLLESESSLNLRVVGHTDADGDDGYNQKLSLERANAVKEVLVSGYGIAAARLSTEGKGESEPVADNNSASGKANNRRVEFVKN
jgi:outer membrane protein OmpA-like peptidoglycan-associated protein